MLRRLRPVAGAALLVAIVAAPLAARADGNPLGPVDKQACLAASDKGQQARIEGKLRLAREQFQICSRSECPGIVRRDCTQWTTEVLSALPSVVIGARDWQGHDLFGVRVSVDGVVIEDNLDGKPILVDPGVHNFKYESSAAPAPVEEKVLVREGEKNRALTVQFAAPPSAVPAQTPSGGPKAGPAAAESKGPPSALAYVFTGVGVAALGASLGLLLWGNGEVTQDERPVGQGGCRGNCDIGAIKTKWDLSGGALGLGIASLGVATYFFIARPTVTNVPQDSKHASLWFDVTPAARGGAALVLGGRFE